MILIVTEKTDISTSQVIDWLKYYNIPFFRINETDKISVEKISIPNNRSKTSNIGEVSIKVNNKKIINLSKIKGYWYRRGRLMHKYRPFNEDDYLGSRFNPFFKKEQDDVIEFIDYYLKVVRKVNVINSFLDNKINKLNNLLIAKDCGLAIPDSYIINRKTQLESLFSKKQKPQEYITKGISQRGVSVNDAQKNFSISDYTVLLNKDCLQEFPETFFTSLVQEKINKKVELRIFYLNGKCYSSAIFSQLDTQTEVDFRRYNRQKPNRVVPYKLPEAVECNIILFMNRINMNCGSLDIIKTTDNNYVFLEVNPVGQFAQVSYPCNYKLEKRIVTTLNA